MNISYWEHNTWLSAIDFTIVGSGIVGLNCALSLREKFPKAKILVLEKGIVPQGASTKNAGFSCFGSISEIVSDLQNHTEEEVLQLVQSRYNGIKLLRDTLGDKAIDFKVFGGHELFVSGKEELYQNCLDKISIVNQLLHPVFKGKAFEIQSNQFNFKCIKDKYISNPFEGQLDTGKMMDSLLSLALAKGIKILNSSEVLQYSNTSKGVEVKTNSFELKTAKLFIATNGFTSKLIDKDVQPARAQVLITNPIPSLKIKGCFHLDEGYFYFRNIHNRILFGGGRNLDFKAEETFEQETTLIIQDKLEEMLAEIILPNETYTIDRRWSGIMGVGKVKNPIISQLEENVFCGVRLGGMGVAIGSHVGNSLANLLN